MRWRDGAVGLHARLPGMTSRVVAFRGRSCHLLADSNGELPIAAGNGKAKEEMEMSTNTEAKPLVEAAGAVAAGGEISGPTATAQPQKRKKQRD